MSPDIQSVTLSQTGEHAYQEREDSELIELACEHGHVKMESRLRNLSAALDNHSGVRTELWFLSVWHTLPLS